MVKGLEAKKIFVREHRCAGLFYGVKRGKEVGLGSFLS